MLDQLDHTQVSTPASLTSSHALASLDDLTYRIGPLAPSQFVTLRAWLTIDEEIALLVPLQLPPALLTHEAFREGYEWGYQNDHLIHLAIPKLVNEIYNTLKRHEPVAGDEEEDACPWVIGYLLGELAALAETDQVFARTGLAHLCFLLSFFHLAALSWPADARTSNEMHALHDESVRLYRARLRPYRQQGKSFDEAQRLALTPSIS